jgi:TonB-linked SusC/RagA family outer membrane protein
LYCFSIGTSAQNAHSTIRGVVTDTEGKPIENASVLEKGSRTGTVTQPGGIFALNLEGTPGEGGRVLEISALGYADKQVAIRDTDFYRIELVETNNALNEVVVVGYGKKKKVDLTGSIASVSSKDIENRPITQLSQALAGLTTGVVVSQGSGQPGNNGAGLTIRGIGSYGAGGGPLILVDGLATSIDDVDPNNIASISVLKDAASASIYGSRAANGVILIETKRGTAGRFSLRYNGYGGWQEATELPDFLSSADYARLLNEANQNMGRSAAYSDAEIEKFENQSDPDNYPNVPHFANLLHSGDGFQVSHNISFSGGNAANRFLFSLSYLKQNGIVTQNDYERYNFLFNEDSKLTDKLSLKLNLNGYASNQRSPRQYDGGMNNMINFALREGPIFAGRKSDGTYGYQDNYSPEGWLASGSFYKGTNKYFLGGAALDWQPVKGLTVSGKAGYNYWSYYNKDYAADFRFDANKYVGPNNLSVSSGEREQLTLQGLATYNLVIGEHRFDLLGGVSEETYKDHSLGGFRKDFPTDLIFELNAGSATGMTNNGTASEWSMRSFFSRLNYSYKDKYLFEANIRADGTSRFPSEGRWGYFPSFSAGWRISEESFIKDNVDWIDNLKFRASWGKLGNQNVGTYPYQNLVSLGQNYSLGGALVPGATTTRLSNQDITWERTTTTDLGLDLDVLKGTLSLVADVFDKKTNGVLYTVATAAVLGLQTSPVNVGSVKNSGVEFSLNYKQSIGQFQLGIAPNFSYTKNRVTSLANGLKEDIGSGLFVGYPINVIYGFVADGLFTNDDDIADYPTQPYSAEPGFPRYKDISGPDGKPDGKVDATYDRQIIGNTIPKYTYGLTLTGRYKGFDFYVLAQGLGGYEKQIGSYAAFAFYNGGQIQRWQADNRWKPENPNPAAAYPKLTSLNMGSGAILSSTYWNRDASFLRIKSIQVGYTLSKNLLEKIKVDKVRIYFSGQNLFSWNHFYKGWDPEMAIATGDNSSFYPLTSVYTFGLNVNF